MSEKNEHSDRAAEQLREAARRIRARDLEMICDAGAGHVGGDMSCADILAVLYFGVLKTSPRRPDDPGRDRFILSKGHCAGALYTTLAAAGFFPDATLAEFMAPGGRLNGHPNRTETPGVETNTGPLGHGLPVAVGAALAAKMRGEFWRTFVLVGDGELQEGSNWEAAMAAAHFGLDNLTVIVDRNGLQQGAATEATNALDPLTDKWRAFGWETAEADGHDVVALQAALSGVPFHAGRPGCLIARTVKGRGVSFMENKAEWHHKVPNPAEREQAARELSEANGRI